MIVAFPARFQSWLRLSRFHAPWQRTRSAELVRTVLSLKVRLIISQSPAAARHTILNKGLIHIHSRTKGVFGRTYLSSWPTLTSIFLHCATGCMTEAMGIG